MKTGIRLFVVGAVLANVTACTYIKNLFPDKEKDYQFTTEIPPLVLPPDLSGDAIAKAPAVAPTDALAPETTGSPAVTDAAPADSAPTAADSASADSANETVSAIERKSIKVELLDAEQGTTRLHIGAPVATAWRIVGKALSRNSIEVVNRNQEERSFRVQYDPDKKVIDEDESFLDEVSFFIEGLQVSEQEYILKLVEDNQQTHVIIMDKDQKPVADKTSLRFLTLLHDTIKADLAK
jgi:outer membrane protein assembly factor BamC